MIQLHFLHGLGLALRLLHRHPVLDVALRLLEGVNGRDTLEDVVLALLHTVIMEVDMIDVEVALHEAEDVDLCLLPLRDDVIAVVALIEVTVVDHVMVLC